MSRWLGFLGLLTGLLFFQNCSVPGSSKAPESGPLKFDNGQTYDGKLYVHREPGNPCADGNEVRSSIVLGTKYWLTKFNCQMLHPSQEILADDIYFDPNDYNVLTYKSEVYVASAPIPAPAPAPGPGAVSQVACTGAKIQFTGSIKVHDPFGGGSSPSCTPLVIANSAVNVPSVALGTSVTVTGGPPWPSPAPVASWDGSNCSASFFFAEYSVRCDANGLQLEAVRNIRYYSGRADTNTYVFRSTFDGVQAGACAAAAGGTSLSCAGTPADGRITVNPGFSIKVF